MPTTSARVVASPGLEQLLAEDRGALAGKDAVVEAKAS